MIDDPHSGGALKAPGAGLGLIDVLRRRHLLTLLVRKEVQIRYRGSALGWLWSYVKPLTQFLVFFVALGLFLGLNGSIDYYPIYLLSGFTAITFFSEAFNNGTKSIVDNAPLIKKIYLPREMFPVASVLVAVVNTFPQVLVVLALALVFGWQFSFSAVGAILLGFLIIALLSTGLGLFFGAVNVAFRDAQAFVEIIIMLAMWASPVMYQWSMVQANVSPLWFDLYRLNPLTPAVELFHYGFWLPLSPARGGAMPDLGFFSLIAALVSILALVIGQLVFRRMEGRFAQEL